MATAVEEKVIRRLRAAGGIEIRQQEGRADLVLSVKGGETEILLEVKHRFSDSILDQIERLPRETRDHTVLVVSELPPKRRQELRFRNISWIEYQSGVVHLRLPHIAIDLPEDVQAGSSTPESLPSLSGKAGIVVEALIERARREELVSQPDVAKLSGSTQAWTSRVFGALVEAEALEVVGSGPSKRWRPRVQALLRLWSADGGPSPTATPMYIWSRSPEGLIRSMARFQDPLDSYAIGGGAAADLHEPTLSSVPVVNVWIPATTPPAKVAADLEAELVDSGANVILWQAPGDPALRLAGTVTTWREDAPGDLAELRVVTPARAAVEALRGPGRSPEVGERLRQRIVEETANAHG